MIKCSLGLQPSVWIMQVSVFVTSCTFCDTNYRQVPILSSVTFVRLNGSLDICGILRILCQVSLVVLASLPISIVML